MYDLADKFAFGATKIFDWLWLAGEEDIDVPLYGRIITQNDIEALNNKRSIKIKPQVDVWIDYRNKTQWDRKVFVPSKVQYIHMPFNDGDYNKARNVWTYSKALIDIMKDEGKRVLVSCHAGCSRSVVMVLWLMAEEIGYDYAWCKLKSLRPHIAPHPEFMPMLKWLKERYT